MRDTIYSHVRAVPAYNAAVVAADGATQGTAVDLAQGKANYRVASVVAYTGSIADGVYTVTVEESANGTTGWAAVPANRLQGSAVLDADNEVAELGVIPQPGVARFLRVVVTASDTTDGGTVGAVMLLGDPSGYPVARS